MGKFRIGLLSLLVFFCTAIFSTSPKAATISAWRQDIDELVSHILVLHPDPFAKTGELTFMRAVEELKDDLPNLTEEQRVARAMQLVALLGDGHTQLEPDRADFAWWYPIRIDEFPDGYFVTSAYVSVKDLAGAELLEVAGRPADEAVEAARSLMGADNEFDHKLRLYAFHNAALMKGLGLAGENLELRARFRLRDGRTVDRTLVPEKSNSPSFKENDATFEWQFRGEMFGPPVGANDQWFSAYRGLPASAFYNIDPSRPAHFIKRHGYTSHAYPEHDAYYLQFNFIDDVAFVPFVREEMAKIDQLKPKRVIVDFRYNFGGDASRARAAIHEFIKREDNPPWEELYLLYGRKTFSAAILTIGEFIEHVPFTSIGEPTGAALNHFGDPTIRPLARTGLKLHVSTLIHQKSDYDDLRKFVPVAVPARFSFADYIAGRDPAVDSILAGEEMRSIPVIATQEGGARAREVYLERKENYGNLGWWQPPTEFELRVVCDTLAEAGRMEDALETCRLTTEIHPTIWNSWYNLAGIQRKIEGLGEKGLESYRCVVEIEPNNWNVPGIKRLFGRLGADPALPEGCPAGE